MIVEEPKLYWDYGNGNITTDNTCAPIYYSGKDDDITIESYWVDAEHTRCIEFAYSNKMPLVWLERENHFKRYNVNPQELRSLTLPKKKYIDALCMIGYISKATDFYRERNGEW